ncbi:MAG TPA: AmmeMemoRadiSam system protein B, partial [Anaerolineae bacterium]|nr:AmmeMemoRadiSam system protein B [Anaerolineae bacterium]
EDPLHLSQQQLFLPYPLARIVSMCNGTKTISQLHQQLCQDTGESLPESLITDTLAQLDKNYLLDNQQSRQAIDKLQTDWRKQPFRPLAFAGLSYPDAEQELDQFLEAFSAEDENTALAKWSDWQGRALISPHIDYQRGGHVYSQVWQRARSAIEAADLILIFATDHHGGAASLTLSSIPYATPYGILPTDQHLVDQLAATIGTENAYALELNHKHEHSIELVATWLHHIRRECCPVIPILIGSFYHFTPDGHPTDDPTIVAFMQKLRELTADKKVFCIASVDLAHVGPAFDNDYLMDNTRKTALAQTDAHLMQAITNGDKEAFYQQLASTRNENNVCGFSPTYLMLDYLGETNGTQIAYDQCSADANNTSTVSICGILLD